MLYLAVWCDLYIYDLAFFAVLALMYRKRRLTMNGRTTIIRLWLQGLCVRDISYLTRASMTTVYRWVKRWQDNGTVMTRPYSKTSRFSLSNYNSQLNSDFSQMIHLSNSLHVPYFLHFQGKPNDKDCGSLQLRKEKPLLHIK